MQRRTALVIAAVAVSAPLLTVGGLAVAADHVRLGPGGERSGTPAQSDHSSPDAGSSYYNGVAPGAESYGDDDCAFGSDGTEPDSDCAPSATVEPGSHHDDDAYDDEAYDDD